MKWLKKLTSLLVTLSLLLSLAGTSFAAIGSSAIQTAAERMVALGLVQGLPGGDLALGSNITRAQLVTIMVRAYGQDEQAKLMAQAPLPFTDVPGGHWATGYIYTANNIIKSQGHTMGVTPTTFNPDGNVTVAEVVAFLLKFLGVPFNAATTPWPDGYLAVAVTAGLFSAADSNELKPMLNTGASRGTVFWMADKAFYSYKLGDGNTVYTKYVAPAAPTLSVNPPTTTTKESKVTLTGSSNGATVYVGSTANMATLANGYFMITVDLAVGVNQLVVYAESLAGKKVSQTVSITRTAGGVLTSLVPSLTSTTTNTMVTIKALDESGKELTGVSYSVSSNDAVVGTTGNFVASKAGTYTVTGTKDGVTVTVDITVIGGAQKAAVSAPAKLVGNGVTKYAVTVSVVDANGNTVAADSTSAVTLTGPGLTIYDKDGAGASLGAKTATVSNGAYTFQVTAPVATLGQTIALTATGSGLTAGGASVQVIQQVATKVSLSGGTYMMVNTSNASSPFLFTATVEDQEGATMLTGTYELTATLTGPATLAANNGTTYTYTTSAGTAAIGVINQQGVTGTVTLTVAASPLGTASRNVNAVIAGAPQKVILSVASAGTPASSHKAGDSLTVTAEVQDISGVPVPYTGTLTISNNSGSANVSMPASVTYTGETAKSFSVTTVGAFTGTYTLSVGAGSGLTTGTTGITVTSGTYTHLALTRNNSNIIISVANPSASLTAQLYDAFGNKVPAAGVKLTFKGHKVAYSAWSSSTATTQEVTFGGVAGTLEVNTDSTGAASVTAATLPFAGQFYTVSVSGNTLLNTPLIVQGTNGNVVGLAVEQSAGSSITVDLLGLNGAVYSGLYLSNAAAPAVVVRATIKDEYGQPKGGQKAALSIAKNKIFWNGTTLTDTVNPVWYDSTDNLTGTDFAGWSLNAGEYVAVVQIAKAGLATVSVKHSSGPTEITGSKDIQVTAAAALLATITQVNESGNLIVAANTVAGPFTVQLTDLYGNYVTSPSKITLTLGGTASVRIQAAGVSVSSIETYGATTIYVTTPAVGTYSITFSVGATPWGTIPVIAQ